MFKRKRFQKGSYLPASRQHPDIYLERLRKIIKNSRTVTQLRIKPGIKATAQTANNVQQ
jgi:hypothetical protein